jgi:hypothetical protein
MRRVTVAVLAAIVALAWLALFAAAEAQLDLGVLERSGIPVIARWVRIVLAAAGALPWGVGAALIAARRPRLGTAVLVTAAVLVVPTLGSVLRGLQELLADPGAAAAGDTMTIVGGAVLWLFAVTTGVLAWTFRPRDGWREGATGPRHGFTAAATLAWLGTTFARTAYAPAGAPRRFIELPAAPEGVMAVAIVGMPLIAAAVLWAAPRLAPAVGTAVLLTYVVPELAASIAAVQEVRTVTDVIFTPAGLLGPVGLLALLGFAVAWAREARACRRGVPAPDEPR